MDDFKQKSKSYLNWRIVVGFFAVFSWAVIMLEWSSPDPAIGSARQRSTTKQVESLITVDQSVDKGATPQKHIEAKATQANPQVIESFIYDLDSIIELIDSGAWQKAETLLNRRLKEVPGDIEALVELAMIQILDKKDPNAAIKLLEEVIRLDPSNQSVMTELIALYEDTMQMENGMRFLLEASTALTTESAAIDYGLGRSLIKLGRADEAIVYFERILSNGSDEIDRFLIEQDLITAYIDSEQYYQAIDYVEMLASEEGLLPEQIRERQESLIEAYQRAGDQQYAEILQDRLKRQFVR